MFVLIVILTCYPRILLAIYTLLGVVTPTAPISTTAPTSTATAVVVMIASCSLKHHCDISLFAEVIQRFHGYAGGDIGRVVLALIKQGGGIIDGVYVEGLAAVVRV